MSESSQTIQDNINSHVKAAKDLAEELFTPTSVENLELLKIGKPTGFCSHVDPKKRIKYYMEAKMNVIDIIPCDYMLPLHKGRKVLDENGDSTALLDSLTPTIGYGQAVEEFQKVCATYGLVRSKGIQYGGLRLYITDETTATDDFSTSYTNNWLDSAFNFLVDKTKTMREIGRSVTSNYDKNARDLGAKLGSAVGETSGEVVDYIAELAGADTNLSGNLKVLGGAVGAAVAAGDRIALPKLWSDTNYTPNITAVVKLVSPYGHPDAIKEFIIKPLMFILIMAAPRTRDGISYGHTPKVTIKGYGTTHIPLAHISNISLRKGGADTSYNIYRQPLSIDVSLQFESLVRGFAAFTGDGNSNRLNTTNWETTNKIKLDFRSAMAGQNAFFPTLGNIVDSIRPIALNKIVTKYNVGELPSTPGLRAAIGDNLSSPKTLIEKEAQKAIVGNSDTLSMQAEQASINQADITIRNQFSRGDTISSVKESLLLSSKE